MRFYCFAVAVVLCQRWPSNDHWDADLLEEVCREHSCGTRLGWPTGVSTLCVLGGYRWNEDSSDYILGTLWLRFIGYSHRGKCRDAVAHNTCLAGEVNTIFPKMQSYNGCRPDKDKHVFPKNLHAGG